MEVAREFLDEIDRTVLAARATDGDSQVAAIVGHETWQPVANEIADVPVHAVDVGVGFQKFEYRGVLAGEWTQHGIVKGVRQAAHVENEVGIERNAVLVAERLEQQ